jgi:hypothetical protein
MPKPTSIDSLTTFSGTSANKRKNKMRLQITGIVLALVTQMAVSNCPNAQAANSAAATTGAAATSSAVLKDWFSKYDEIRREAQMNPVDKQKADSMLSKGLAMFMPGPEKMEIQTLLQKLQLKNSIAADKLKKLNLYPETKALHFGYYQYFNDAQTLFGDYLKVQDNLMAKDAQGNSVMGQLMGRKAALEQLDIKNKALDEQLRQQLVIAPYRY